MEGRTEVRIHITESAYRRLFESDDDYVPFLDFYDEVVGFVKGILNDPIGTKASEKLRSWGLDGKRLRKLLADNGIISKTEDIDEPLDETNGKEESRYYVSYEMHTENFKDKIRKIYKEIFESEQ